MDRRVISSPEAFKYSNLCRPRDLSARQEFIYRAPSTRILPVLVWQWAMTQPHFLFTRTFTSYGPRAVRSGCLLSLGFVWIMVLRSFHWWLVLFFVNNESRIRQGPEFMKPYFISHCCLSVFVFKCLLKSQLFLYTTVVVLMTLFLIFCYNPSENLYPLVGWITKQTWKRDCLSSVPWISEHEAMDTCL